MRSALPFRRPHRKKQATNGPRTEGGRWSGSFLRRHLIFEQWRLEFLSIGLVFVPEAERSAISWVVPFKTCQLFVQCDGVSYLLGNPEFVGRFGIRVGVRPVQPRGDTVGLKRSIVMG